MQKHFLPLLFSFLFLPFVGFSQSIDEILKNPRRVMDFANVISAETENTLNDSLYHFEQSTSNQIIFLTLETIPENEDEFSFSMKVAEGLKIGQTKKDNGVFVLLTTGQNRTFKIYPGRGLEGAIPDALIDQFFRNAIRPLLKKGQIDQAMIETYLMISLASRGEYKAEKKSGDGKIPSGFVIAGIIVFAILYFALSRLSRLGRQVTTIGGQNYGRRSNNSGPRIFPPFFGGGFGGGSSSGGGIDFGGFSGGGGSFGGGGGGGSW